MSYLLDTSVVSELIRPAPDKGVVTWIEAQEELSLFLSVLTIGELEKGIAKLADARRKIRLHKWVHDDLGTRFEGRVLAVDRSIAEHWGILNGRSERKGQSLPVIDSLIAATALVHGLKVVSRNAVDFERCGVGLINPWVA